LPFETKAICILPDHIHALWTLPPGDSDFASRWSQIKRGFSRVIPAAQLRSASQLQKRERHLAKALLGACDSRRRRFRAPCRLHPFQPSEARLRDSGVRLAVQQLPSLREEWLAPSGLGRKSR
jgi:transposase